MCNVLTFDLAYNDYVTMTCDINGIEKNCSYLVDTQADISVLKYSSIPGRLNINTKDVINIKGITKDSLRSLGTLHIKLFTDQDEIDHEFHVVPDEFNIDCDGIIGKDFLVNYKCRIDYDSMTFTINNRYRNILNLSGSPDGKTMVIPPRCEVIRKFNVYGDEECFIDQLIMRPGVYTARTIVNPANAYIKVVNTTNEPQKISNAISKTEPLGDFNIFKADEVTRDAKRIEKLKNIVQNNVPRQYGGKFE